MHLTIAIPTYDRPEKILDRIREIILHNPTTINVIVVDNCSKIPVKEYITSNIEEVPKWITFVRNRANLGLSGNICRCLEYATGSWVWLLGDDDRLKPDSIKNILDEISKIASDNSVAGINFSTDIKIYPERKVFTSLEQYAEFISDSVNLCNAFFISSCVLNVDICLKFFRQATQAISTYAPHVAICLTCLDEGYSWIVTPVETVYHVPPDSSNGWNTTIVSLGMPLLLDVLPNSITLRENLCKSLPHHLRSLTLKSGLKNIIFETSKSPYFWEVYYFRVLPLIRGRRYLVILFLAIFSRISARIPLMRRALIFLLYKFTSEKLEQSSTFDRL